MSMLSFDAWLARCIFAIWSGPCPSLVCPINVLYLACKPVYYCWTNYQYLRFVRSLINSSAYALWTLFAPQPLQISIPKKTNRYGGPGSQLVDLRFGRDWHEYLACGLDYIIVTVDGRGTGFKGRKLRNPVKDNLGFYETVDQIAAAK